MHTNQPESSTENTNILNDSLFDMFSCTFSQIQQPVSPKRKQDNAPQAPSAPKTRNKLSLVKDSQKNKIANKENGTVDSTTCVNKTKENELEDDSDIFCSQILKKIESESLEFTDNQNSSTLQGMYVYFSKKSDLVSQNTY